MLITELGEFGLIARIKKSVKTDASVIRGIGDDCAVVRFNRARYLLLTTDMIIEGVDFTKNDDPYLIGKKALAVSLSDIAACAGLPRYCLVSLGLPRNSSLEKIDKIRSGITDLAAKYKVNLVGGDLSRSDKLVINTAVLGIVEKKRLVLRNGARPGDKIFVSGSLGGSISGKHLRFCPRIEEARFLAANYKPSSMIDISDGLAQDLGHILAESRAGAMLYEELIPVSPQARSLQDALYGGEDFELLFTASPRASKKILKSRRYGFKLIGEIVDKKHGLLLIDRGGKVKKAKSAGFRHF